MAGVEGQNPVKTRKQIPTDAEPRIRALSMRIEESDFDYRRSMRLEIGVISCKPDGTDTRSAEYNGSRTGDWFHNGMHATIVHPLTDGSLSGFKISTYVDADPKKYRDNQADTTPRGAWGQKYGFVDVDLSDPDDAMACTQVLRHVRRAMDDAYTAGGPHASFGWFATRIARAIGASGIVVAAKSHWSANADGNRVMGLDGAAMAYALDSAIQAWIESKQPAALRSLAAGE